jgi:hypothetical protein
MQKSDPQQAVEHRARERRGVPDVGHLDAGHERECPGPIGPGVPRYADPGVAFGAALHVTRLRGPATVQPGAVAPLGAVVSTRGGGIRPNALVRGEQVRPSVNRSPMGTRVLRKSKCRQSARFACSW